MRVCFEQVHPLHYISITPPSFLLFQTLVGFIMLSSYVCMCVYVCMYVCVYIYMLYFKPLHPLSIFLFPSPLCLSLPPPLIFMSYLSLSLYLYIYLHVLKFQIFWSKFSSGIIFLLSEKNPLTFLVVQVC
jgi:hypothetical protein